MTTQTATTAFINALIVRLRTSMATGVKATRAPNTHWRNRPLADPVLIPAYRRRAQFARSKVARHAPQQPGTTLEKTITS